ncbi:MAG: glycine/sarcosine/betaine reductase selenoprotein B family protein [Myxococcota bacterium]
MGDLAEFPFGLRTFLRAYRWRRVDPIPWVDPKRPLAQSRVALVSTAGFVLDGQLPFDSSIRGGDLSFREIPGDADVAQLVDTHRSESFDHTGMTQDPNLAFPIDRIRELAARGRIGEPAPRHLSFMGSILAPGRLVRDTAPEAARRLREDGVDAALLVPV